MEGNNPLALRVKWPYAQQFGLLGGFLVIGVTLIMYLFAGDSVSLQKQGLFSLASFILIFVLAHRAVKSYRNEHLGGFIHFKDAFQVAALAGGLCGFLGSLFNLIYLTYVDAGYVDLLIRQMEEMYLNMGMSEGDVEKALEKMKEGFSTRSLAMGLVTGPTIYGLVVGLVGGLIGRKKNPALDADL